MTVEEMTARIFDLETELANVRLEYAALESAQQEAVQSRERHALEVIRDIASGAAMGDDVPTLETVRIEFDRFCERMAGTKGMSKNTLMVCADGLDDIIAGRWRSHWLTARELIERETARIKGETA